MNVDMALIARATRPHCPMIAVRLVFGHDVALGTQGEIRGLVALLQHARLVRPMRRVAVQAAAFLRGEIERRLVLIRERPAKFVMALEAGLTGSRVRVVARRKVERHVAIAAFDNTVFNRMAKRQRKRAFYVLVAPGAQLCFIVLEETRMVVSMQLVATRAVDLVLRVHVLFFHVLNVRFNMAAGTHLRGRAGIEVDRIRHWIRFRVVVVPFIKPVTAHARNLGPLVADFYRVGSAHQLRRRVVMAIEARFTFVRVVLRNDLLVWDDGEKKNSEQHDWNEKQNSLHR
jgi:hypothetical protein